MIDKHVKLQHGQFSLPGEIKQQAGFIEQAIINGDLKGFKAEMLQQYVQSALKQFHETGKWQGVWKVLKDQGGEWEQAMDDPQNSMNVIDALFELEMSKSDPIYKKLQTAVHQAESCDRYLQWIESYFSMRSRRSLPGIPNSSSPVAGAVRCSSEAATGVPRQVEHSR
jgi:hypothetical protein